MSELDDRIADSQRVTDYLRSLQQGGGTPPIVDRPPVVDKPPVVDPPVVTGPVSFQGDLYFSGTRVDTAGVSDQVAAFRVVIPAPLPDGWSGRIAPVSCFENGNPMRWRHITLSRTMGDMSGASPYTAGGNGGATLNLGFNVSGDSVVTVASGDIWYVNIKNELYTPFSSPPYQPTCDQGGNGNFGVKLYPPS